MIGPEPEYSQADSNPPRCSIDSPMPYMITTRMKTLLNARVFGMVCLGFLLGYELLAQPVPGIPEPGLVVYGRILASDGETTIPIDELQLQFLNSTTQSPLIGIRVRTEIVSRGGESFFVAHIPFETVLPGMQDSADILNFNQTSSVDDVYRLNVPSPFNNPNRARLDQEESSVVGVSALPSVSEFTFGRGNLRGKVVRMDIITDFSAPAPSGFDAWIGMFASIPPELRGRMADPDGDGQVNEFEWIAGLDPTNSDPESLLNQFVLEIDSVTGDGSVTIRFRPKVAGRAYTLRRTEQVSEAVSWVPIPIDTESNSTELLPGIEEVTIQDDVGVTEQGFYSVVVELNR